MKGIIFFIFGLLSYFWAVFVEMKVYNWFMPDAFGLPILSYPEMGGIAIFFGLVVSTSFKKEIIVPYTEREKIGRIIFAFIAYTFGLGIAYLWRLAI